MIIKNEGSTDYFTMKHYVNMWNKEYNKKRRLYFIKKFGGKCMYCGDSNSRLHFHHVLYNGKDQRKNSILYKYIEDNPNKILLLCPKCHKKEHQHLDNLEFRA